MDASALPGLKRELIEPERFDPKRASQRPEALITSEVDA
jgi:hypothetical protein